MIEVPAAITIWGTFAWAEIGATASAMGAVGGWAASVRQHVPFRRAPFSNLLAGAVTLSGVLAGKVPRGARQQLDYGPFTNFCAFNVDAERTASLCWERIAELSGAPVIAK